MPKCVMHSVHKHGGTPSRENTSAPIGGQSSRSEQAANLFAGHGAYASLRLGGATVLHGFFLARRPIWSARIVSRSHGLDTTRRMQNFNENGQATQPKVKRPAPVGVGPCWISFLSSLGYWVGLVSFRAIATPVTPRPAATT